MAKVLGIGGVFFKAPDVKAVQEWYQRVLGFELTSWGGVKFPPLEKGVTVWSAFPDTTKHFAPSEAAWMVNYVVDDLDGLLERIRAEGVEVLAEDSESDPFGRFAWVMDPAGVKVELWEPKAKG